MGFLKPSEWGAAAAVAGITYGAMLVASVLLGLILILLFNAALEEAGNSAFGMDELVTFLRERGGAYLAVAFIVQLTAMGLGGRFHLRLSGDQPGQLLTASIHHVPLLVTVVGVLALYWSSRVLARRRASRGDHPGAVAVWLSSLVSAVMLTVGAVLISLILAGRASETDGYTTLTMRFSAVSPGLSLIPLVVGTLVGVWGRRAGAGSAPTPVSDRVHRWVPGLAPAARLTGLYLGAMAVLCLVAFSLQSAISEGSVVVFFGGLLFGGFGAVDLLGLLHLSGVSLSMASVGERISETGYLWSGDLSGWGVRWLMLLWIPMLLGLCALAFAWAGRRPVLNRGTSWIAMPTVFLLAGILVLWAGRLGAEASAIGYFDVHARVGASWWTPLVFLIWGGIVEAAARYLVPRVAGSVPQGRFRRLLLGAPVPVAFTAGAAAASGADAARSGDEAAGPGGVPGDGAAPSGDAATPTAAPAAAGGGGVPSPSWVRRPCRCPWVPPRRRRRRAPLVRLKNPPRDRRPASPPVLRPAPPPGPTPPRVGCRRPRRCPRRRRSG